MNMVAALALLSALFYCIAMVAMKSWWTLPSLGVATIIAVALLTAGAFEVAALGREKLGLIYVAVMGAEVIILGVVSHFFFEEVYSVKEAAGMALVLVGTAVAWT